VLVQAPALQLAQALAVLLVQASPGRAPLAPPVRANRA